MRIPRDRPLQRAVRLLAGVVPFEVSLADLLRARLGLDPWDVFDQGVSRRTGLSIGTVTVIASVLLLAEWVPLRRRPRPGTIANALLVGPVLDVALRLVPVPQQLVGRWAFLLAATVSAVVATGLYVGAGWRPGPRDGLMTGLATRGVSVAAARAGIEITVLAVGWAFGGSVGIATVLFAAAIGPLVSCFCRG